MHSHPGQTQPPLCSPIHTEAARLDTRVAVLGARAVGSREADPGRRGLGQESRGDMSRVKLPLPRCHIVHTNLGCHCIAMSQTPAPSHPLSAGDHPHAGTQNPSETIFFLAPEAGLPPGKKKLT